MLSKTSNYAIKAVLFIAFSSQQGRRVGIKEIAEYIDSPEPFTAKIVQQLVKANLLHSSKGRNGGFEMTEDQRLNTNIKDIVTELDGTDLYTKCGLGLDGCNDEKPCPMHALYKPIKDSIVDLHTNYTIDEMAASLANNTVLK